MTILRPLVLSMCALSRSAEYSELTSPERHTCDVTQTESIEAFDPWSGCWYAVVIYHC